MIHIYFDMDGVLAKYDRSAYMEDPETHERLFETKHMNVSSRRKTSIISGMSPLMTK